VVAVVVHDMLAVVVPAVTSLPTMRRSLAVMYSASVWVVAESARVVVTNMQKVARIRR
jgi:hypothetical protein